MKCGKYRLYAYNVDYMHIPYNYIPHDDHLHTHTHTGMHTDRHTDTQTHTHLLYLIQVTVMLADSA